MNLHIADCDSGSRTVTSMCSLSQLSSFTVISRVQRSANPPPILKLPTPRPLAKPKDCFRPSTRSKKCASLTRKPNKGGVAVSSYGALELPRVALDPGSSYLIFSWRSAGTAACSRRRSRILGSTSFLLLQRLDHAPSAIVPTCINLADSRINQASRNDSTGARQRDIQVQGLCCRTGHLRLPLPGGGRLSSMTSCLLAPLAFLSFAPDSGSVCCLSGDCTSWSSVSPTKSERREPSSPMEEWASPDRLNCDLGGLEAEEDPLPKDSAAAPAKDYQRFHFSSGALI